MVFPFIDFGPALADILYSMFSVKAMFFPFLMDLKIQCLAFSPLLFEVFDSFQFAINAYHYSAI